MSEFIEAVPTFDEMDAGIRFDADGSVVLSESSPRPGVRVPESVYQAYLRAQPFRPPIERPLR